MTEDPQAELHADASGQATIYQAGRDQHVEHHEHYEDGVRHTRRAAPSTDVCPYPGMGAFRQHQAEWFFGRQKLVAALLDKVDRGRGPLMVVAPSGAGKSSVLQAGLMHDVAQGRLGPREWSCVLLTPTESPLNALETALNGITTDKAVVIIDQLEELFTLCEKEDERNSFLDRTARLAEQPTTTVVYGLRADFYAQCTTRPQLRTVLQDGQTVVAAMTEDELREAILHPARRAGLRVEPGLVDLLVKDIGMTTRNGYEAGRLPLLAHALRATWQQRAGSTLTVEGYKATGGIENAVATGAGEVHTRLSDHDQSLAKTLFLRLVKIGDGVEDVRRRVPRDTLLADLPTEDKPNATKVLDAFTEGRLLTQRQDTVEITHEALLYAWPTLHGWIETDRAGLQLEQNLLEAAQTWQRHDRDPDTLYRGVELDQVRTWTSKRLTPLGQEFLHASLRASRRRVLIRSAVILTVIMLLLAAVGAMTYGFQQRGEAFELQQDKFALGLVAQADAARGVSSELALRLGLAAHHLSPTANARSGLVTTLTSTHDAGTLAYNALGQVVVSRDGALMAGVTHERGSSSLALWDLTDPTHPREAARVRDIGETLAFGPQRMLAVREPGGLLGLWSAADARHPRKLGRIDELMATAASFSPDGHTLVVVPRPSSRPNFPLSLWDITDPARPRKIGQLLTNFVRDNPFSTRGDLVATAQRTPEGETVVLSDVSDPSRPRELGRTPVVGDGIQAMAFSPDGQTLAVASGWEPQLASSLTLWGIKDPRQPVKLHEAPPSHRNVVNALNFNPEGTLLASADDDGTTIVWDTADPASFQQLLPPMTSNSGGVRSVVFVDWGVLVSASYSGVVNLWNTSFQPRKLIQLSANALSADIRILASVDNWTTTLWDFSTPPRRGALTGSVLGISPNGHALLSASSERRGLAGPLDVWDISDPGRPHRRGTFELEGFLDANVFDHSGRWLFTASGAEVGVWDVASSPRATARFSPDLSAGWSVSALALSPASRVLAVGGRFGTLEVSGPRTVVLWDVTDPWQPRLVAGLPGAVNTVLDMVFSADGHTLAVLNADGSITLWDTEESSAPRALSTVRGSSMRSNLDPAVVRINPAGTIMATTHVDGSVMLWDVTNRERPNKLDLQLTGHTAPIRDLGFSPDGNTVATIANDDTATYWDISEVTDIVAHPVEHACARAQRGLNEDEWAHYVGTEYVRTC